MKRVFVAAGLAAALLGAAPAASSAQGDAGTAGPLDPGQERSTQFRRVQGPTTEDVPGGPLLVAAYAIAWVLILAYVARLGFLNARVARDLRRLEKALRAKDAAAPVGDAPPPKQP